MPDVTAPDGVRLHYEDAGEGLPVLALPGLTRDGRDFDHVAPHLPVRLIRLDARGRGRSEHAEPWTYSVLAESQDVLALLDHLRLPRAAILGTSRGGLVAMALAATARDRIVGVALNDVGPVIEPAGLAAIEAYIGRRPAQRTHAAAAEARAKASPAFEGVPAERWLAEARNHYDETESGLALRYDPRLREAFLSAGEIPPLWPWFDALDGLPLCLVRGANSDLLSRRTADEMARRRPDMVRAEVPGRGHVPFLDEPEALVALRAWVALCEAAWTST
jgi:pimeloyl-ACP methyl ester carboxylesterase